MSTDVTSVIIATSIGIIIGIKVIQISINTVTEEAIASIATFLPLRLISLARQMTHSLSAMPGCFLLGMVVKVPFPRFIETLLSR